MLVQVKFEGEHHYVMVHNFSDSGKERDNVRRVAFRFIAKRREVDYQELFSNTIILKTVTPSPETVDFLLQMR